MADHPHPPQVSPQTGVKGIKADAQKRAETDLDLQKLTIDERNRYLESKSFQAQTHDEEYQGRAVEQAERLDGKVVDRDGSAKGKDIDDDQHEGDNEDDDQAFRRQWRERRLQEMKQQHHSAHHITEDREGQDETNDDWKLEKHRLREVGPEGFLKAVEGSGWTAVLLYEPDLPRCQPFIQAFVDLSSSNPSNSTISFLKARATSLSFSLLPQSQSQSRSKYSSIPEEREDDHDDDDDDDDTRDVASHSQSQSQQRSDPDVLPSVLVYKAGELKESFIRIDFDVQEGQEVDGGLADELGRLFRRRVIDPEAKRIGFDVFEIIRGVDS